MPGVVIADDFSVTRHVQRLVTTTNYALRVLRCHGLSNAALQHVYRATVVARLTYATSAWRGLTKASDRRRINLVIDRARRLGYCSPDLLTFDELCDIADDELFSGRTTYCTHYYHHHPLRHNATISGTVLTQHKLET